MSLGEDKNLPYEGERMLFEIAKKDYPIIIKRPMNFHGSFTLVGLHPH